MHMRLALRGILFKTFVSRVSISSVSPKYANEKIMEKYVYVTNLILLRSTTIHFLFSTAIKMGLRNSTAL